MARVLAIDLGSSSGRAVRGEYQDGSLTYREIYRFENVPVQKGRYLCWDFDLLLGEVKHAMEMAGDIDSIGIDTWGADFGILDKKGKLLMPPVHYRDRRTEGMTEKAQEKFSTKELFQMCGNQTYATNSLYQILALKETEPELWNQTAKILHMPDLINYFLCGNAVCERTIACTTQMLEPVSRSWNQRVLEAYQIPETLFAPLTDSGTVIGEYTGKGTKPVKVIAVAGHDTQSAGAAMTEDPDSTAFLNIGTWSLLGVERKQPILTDLGFELGISNEQGPYRDIQCIMNIVGTWLLQECRREWTAEGRMASYNELERQAALCDPFQCFIAPNSPDFALPGHMPEKIQAFCRKTGQRAPESAGEVVRCIYESLALKYRRELEKLEQGMAEEEEKRPHAQKSAGRIEKLQILGGGAQSEMLCQMTADICRKQVIAGPVEATALGNLVIQLKALGEIADEEAARETIRRAETTTTFIPNDEIEVRKAIENAYQRFKEIDN